MKNIYTKISFQRGFTLVELIVAISIVAVLAALSISGYSAFRKSSLLSLSVDSFVLKLNELKDDGSGDCRGVSFGDTVYTYSQEFSDKKVWKNELVEFGYVGCDGEIFNNRPLEIDDSVKFNKITLFNEADESLVLDSFGMRFLPPRGQLEISLNGGPYVEPYYKSVEFSITSGQENERLVRYDFTSLNVVDGD